MSVALSIAFTGLCALISDGDGRPGEILLVDARGVGEVGGVRLPAHAPSLVLSLDTLANPESSAPTRVIAGTPSRTGRVDQIGIWDLTGSEIRIRAEGTEGRGVRLFRPSPGESSWPEPPRDTHDPAAWRDLRFVANMEALVGDGRIDPALVGASGSGPDGLPRAVAARILLDAGLLEATIPSQDAYGEDVFEFKNGGSDASLRQALTDTIQWTLQTDAAAVVIDITPVGGGQTKRLLLAPSEMPHQLFVSNLPAENPSKGEAHEGMSDVEMGALHFGAYYKLLLAEPRQQPTPELWRPLLDRRGAGFLRTAICPPAVFTRH